mmetsp:Transcript_14432/g.34453  ORF Transcript_14432/g.34453 Transcript_14432/m.34453 type:complete len:202 (+) Transcript_14432:771-1376(+)
MDPWRAGGTLGLFDTPAASSFPPPSVSTSWPRWLPWLSLRRLSTMLTAWLTAWGVPCGALIPSAVVDSGRLEMDSVTAAGMSNMVSVSVNIDRIWLESTPPSVCLLSRDRIGEWGERLPSEDVLSPLTPPESTLVLALLSWELRSVAGEEPRRRFERAMDGLRCPSDLFILLLLAWSRREACLRSVPPTSLMAWERSSLLI